MGQIFHVERQPFEETTNGFPPIRVGIVYVEKLIVDSKEYVNEPVVGESSDSQILLNIDGRKTGNELLLFDKDTGTLLTPAIAAPDGDTTELSISNSNATGSLVLESTGVDSYVTMAAGENMEADYEPQRVEIISSALGSTLNMQSAYNTLFLESDAISYVRMFTGIAGITPPTFTINTGLNEAGTGMGDVTIASGQVSGTATAAGSVSLVSSGALTFDVGKNNAYSQGELNLLVPSSGPGTAGQLRFVTNECTYVWPRHTTAPANGSVLMVTDYTGSTATLGFVPISGAATVSSTGLFNLADNSVTTAKVVDASISPAAFVTTGTVATAQLSSYGVAGTYTRPTMTVDGMGRISAISSGAITTCYTQLQRLSSTQSITAGTDVLLNTVILDSGHLTYNQATGILTLLPNKRYMMHFIFKTTLPQPGWAKYRFTDSSNAYITGEETMTQANTNTTLTSHNNHMTMIYDARVDNYVTRDLNVKVRCTSMLNANAATLGTGTTWIVHQI